MSKKYYSQDITFCSNNKCRIKSCPRNPVHVSDTRVYYTCADLEGTDCCKKRKGD